MTDTERNIVSQVAAVVTLLVSKGVITQREYIEELKRVSAVAKLMPDAALLPEITDKPA